MSMSVCLSVCLSVRPHNSKTAQPNFTNFSACNVPVAMASSSSYGVAIRRVLPVLRMTSCFHTVGPVGRIKHVAVFRGVRQITIPVARHTTAVFGYLGNE